MLRNGYPNHLDTPTTRPLLASALAAALALSLGACSKGGEASAKATQVAAKVGDTEISVHQINQILNRTPMEAPSQQALQAASKQVLERLIDQQVAVNAATEDNLQRTPEVIAAIEAARRDVLARAYMQKFSANAAKPNPEDVARYYRENPALFAERRIFSLQEIRVPDASTVLPELRAMAEQGKTAEDIGNFLNSKQIRFAGNNSTRAAEQIPLELLPKVHALQGGRGQVFQAGTGATVIRVAGSVRAGMNEEEARPIIEKFLANQRLNDLFKQEVQRLRGATTISYMGEFNSPAGNATTTSEPRNQAPSPAAAPAIVDQSTLERGVKGLK